MYKLFIGLNDKDLKKQVIATEQALAIIENIAFNTLEYGATIEQARGIYKHETGERVRENTITLLTSESEKIEGLIKELKSALNQESIAIIELAEMRFI